MKTSRIYTFFISIFYVLLKMLFFIEFKGTNRISKDISVIICANHISNFDPFSVAAGLNRQICYMAKDSLFKIPVLNQLLNIVGTFPVDRKRADLGAIRNAIKILNEGRVLGIFPQGTRGKQNDDQDDVKAGIGLIAFKTKASVLPVKIVTKNESVRIFRKITVIYGDIITFENLGFERGGQKEFLTVSNMIFDKIKNLS